MTGRIFSSIIPVALGILGVLIANFPVSFFGGLVPPPLLAFMPLYFWAMVRPDLMTPFWAFMLGLMEDFFSVGPPGVWAASFLAAYFLIDRQRDMLAGPVGHHRDHRLRRHRAGRLRFGLYHRQHLRLARPAAGAGDGRTGDDGRRLHLRRLPLGRHSSPPRRTAQE